MKVNELRTKIKNYKKDELQQLIVEMYKQIPKKMREAKEIDRLIDNPDAFKKIRKNKKQSVKNLDFNSVEQEVKTFIKNARLQNYVAPNQVISKKERSNWRFVAKRLLEQVTVFASHPEHRHTCASLLEEMYKLFTYASGHYVFASTEPFHTLKIPQEDFLKRVVLLKKAVEDPDKWISDSLKLILEHDVDHDTLTSTLLEVLLSTLNNAPLKERMIHIAKEILQEKQKALKESGQLSKQFISWNDEQYINHLTEMIFMTQSSLGEYETAIGFFKNNYIQFEEEVDSFVLLDLIMRYQRVEEWIIEYEIAVQRGIELRKSLQEAYEYIKRERKFPSYI